MPHACPRSPSLQGSWLPPQPGLRGTVSTVLEFEGGVARALAWSSPTSSLADHILPLRSVPAAGGGGGTWYWEAGRRVSCCPGSAPPSLQHYVGPWVEGGTRLETQILMRVRCFRSGVRTGQLGLTRPTSTDPTKHSLGKLRTAQTSDEQERSGKGMKWEKGP